MMNWTQGRGIIGQRKGRIGRESCSPGGRAGYPGGGYWYAPLALPSTHISSQTLANQRFGSDLCRSIG